MVVARTARFTARALHLTPPLLEEEGCDKCVWFLMPLLGWLEWWLLCDYRLGIDYSCLGAMCHSQLAHF